MRVVSAGAGARLALYLKDANENVTFRSGIQMAKQIFFVAITSNAEAVAKKIQSEVEVDDTYKLADDKWFIVFDGVSRELAEKIGIRTTPHIGNGIVMPVESYSGRAPTQLWEWLKLQMERQ